MVRNRRTNARRARRTKRTRKARKPRLPASAIRNNASVTVSVPAIREFSIYPKQITTTIINNTLNAVSNIWLDSLKTLGLIALKLFVYAVTTAETNLISNTSGVHYKATKSYTVGTAQSILIGVEDLLFSSPIVEEESISTGQSSSELVPVVDFIQAKLTTATIRVTSGSPNQSRAGRFVSCIMDLTEEEIATYFTGGQYDPFRAYDSWSFADIIQMPGAVTAPFGTPITLTWRAKPSSYAYRFLEVGTPQVPTPTEADQNPRGGKPSFRLLIGYQDYASSTGSLTALYSPDEAILHVDIRGHVMLKEKGRRYIRAFPLTTMDSSAVAFRNTNGRLEDVSLSSFATYENGVLARVEGLDLHDCMLE